MQRRRLLQLAGTVFGGASLALGSGAFTSVSAERSVKIAVADDEDAFLGMNAISNHGRTYEFGNSEQIAFSIPGVQENTPGDTLAQGVGQNSRYTFSDLLEITNRGDDTVEVWSKPGDLAPGIDYLALVNNDDHANLLDEQSKAVLLGPGESFNAGLFIDTGSELGSFDMTLAIMAEEPSAATESVIDGTSRQLAVGTVRTAGPSTNDNSGVRFTLTNNYRANSPITITDVNITPADGNIELVSDQVGGTNYDNFSFNADVHIEATPQDGYVDGGGTEFRLPATVDLNAGGFTDSADQEAMLDPRTTAVVNLYSFRGPSGQKLDMTGRRLDLTFTVMLPDGTEDRVHTSVLP